MCIRDRRYADELDIAVNVYLEDWSNGMKDSSDYVFQLLSLIHILHRFVKKVWTKSWRRQVLPSVNRDVLLVWL